MANDYRRLWTDVANAKGEAKAVQILAEILADKEGRVFILNLDSEGAKLCIEILDRVSRDPRLLQVLLSSSQMASPGHRKPQPRSSREAAILHRIEEARCIPRQTTGVHDNY